MSGRVRMNFLNHLEQWQERSVQTAEDAAQSKQEELASELDLRLHLHAPRAKRIEVDVRNVRAGEVISGQPTAGELRSRQAAERK